MPNLNLGHTAGTPADSSAHTTYPLARLDSLPIGQGRCFSVGVLKLAVFRQRDGRVFAIDANCPHRDGPLADGIVGSGIVVCPLHAYRFRLDDGSGVDTDLNVRTYPVAVDNGWIVLLRPQSN